MSFVSMVMVHSTPRQVGIRGLAATIVSVLGRDGALGVLRDEESDSRGSRAEISAFVLVKLSLRAFA